MAAEDTNASGPRGQQDERDFWQLTNREQIAGFPLRETTHCPLRLLRAHLELFHDLLQPPYPRCLLLRAGDRLREFLLVRERASVPAGLRRLVLREALLQLRGDFNDARLGVVFDRDFEQLAAIHARVQRDLSTNRDDVA